MCFFNSGGGNDEPQQTSQQPVQTPTPGGSGTGGGGGGGGSKTPATSRSNSKRGSLNATGRTSGSSRRKSLQKRKPETNLTSGTVLGSSGSGAGKTLLGA